MLHLNPRKKLTPKGTPPNQVSRKAKSKRVSRDRYLLDRAWDRRVAKSPDWHERNIL